MILLKNWVNLKIWKMKHSGKKNNDIKDRYYLNFLDKAIPNDDALFQNLAKKIWQ